MPNVRRNHTGPNGVWNYLPDNSTIVLTRNPAGNVIRIDMTGPHGQAYHRIITRNLAEEITDVGFWIQDVI